MHSRESNINGNLAIRKNQNKENHVISLQLFFNKEACPSSGDSGGIFGRYLGDMWRKCEGHVDELWRKLIGKLEEIKRRLEVKNLVLKNIIF